jgi:hypothetical protein
MTNKMTYEMAKEIIKEHQHENFDRCDPDPDDHESEYYDASGFIDGHDSREAELNSLKNQIEIAEKALVYCAIQPELLQPENNRQCACAYNALNELRVLKEMEK